ncbi:MAG: hypothetical protein M0R17_04775 [Candidatus Omnitrophica bacterium]|jgi:hypothetical protein|nr:hypothetical protein [Candidatus Omnitrophota bacterium]
MTKQEIEKLFLEGKPVTSKFHIKSVKHYCDNIQITSTQFSNLIRKFKDKYDLKNEYGGLTTHTYTYKPDSNG